MSRYLSHLAELQPAMFVELSPELAGEIGVGPGDWVTLVSACGAIEARAMPTRRMRPSTVAGRTVHQIAIHFHWRPTGPQTGDVANDLIPSRRADELTPALG